MPTVQEHLNNTYKKDATEIFLNGKKDNISLSGSDLIIEAFNSLEYIYIAELPNLTKVTLKDCKELGHLDINLEKQIELILNNCPKLNNIKTKNTQNPTIVYQDKKDGCWWCTLAPIVIIAIVMLGMAVFYLISKFNEMKELVRELRKRIKVLSS